MTAPTVAQALQQGVVAHRDGKLQEAMRMYRIILDIEPQHSDANHNLGVISSQMGRYDEAIGFFQTALRVNPNALQFWLSLINILINQGHLKESREHLKQAKSKNFPIGSFDELEKKLTARQDFTKDILPLVNAYGSGNFVTVMAGAKALSKKYPQSAFLWNLEGAASVAAKEMARGIKNYRRATIINPLISEYYYNIGNALSEQRKFSQAIEYYKRAVKVNANNAEAYFNLGNAFRDSSKLNSAIESYIQAINIKPGFESVFNSLGVILQKTRFETPYPELLAVCERLIGPENFVRPVEVVGPLISLLKAEPNIKKVLCHSFPISTTSDFLNLIDILNSFPLLGRLISIAPIPDLTFEKLFYEIRGFFLANITRLRMTKKQLQFFENLALHCFTNEYIYLESDEETNRVQCLEEKVRLQLDEDIQPTVSEILCLACFRHLEKFGWAEKLIFGSDFSELERRFIREPQKERELASQIEKLGEIKNQVSVQVRNQYEENPYPRWVGIGLVRYLPKVRGKENTIENIISEIGLKINKGDIKKIKNPKILVAGCGTGQHSISCASRFKNPEVTAIDLSLTSLGYAQRKTIELGIKNIKYMQADILQIAQLDHSFDLIECGGVLHHMDDPMEGWKVLVDVLRPSGLMKVGLYSERARQNILNYRSINSKFKKPLSAKNIKALRHEIIAKDDSISNELTTNLDFYSLSETRDLLFHVKEHQFTLPKIKYALQSLKLQFCGFENDTLVNLFFEKYGKDSDVYDLDKWHQFEIEHPKAFIGMYQFWCQK